MSRSTSEHNAFELQNVTVDFGSVSGPVLQHLNAEIPAGQFLSIVGPSGCGKSTLLRLLAGLQPVSSGHLLRNGSADPVVPPGFVFQQPALLPWRTVLANLRLPCELGSYRGPASTDDELLQLLQQVGLSADDVSKRPAELSGGMQMRLSLARALVHRPGILLLDEPFAAVDDLLRMKLQELVRNLHDARGLTTILVTHNLQEAAFLSDRILVLQPAPAGLVCDLSSGRVGEHAAWRMSAEVTNLQHQLTKALLNQ